MKGARNQERLYSYPQLTSCGGSLSPWSKFNRHSWSIFHRRQHPACGLSTRAAFEVGENYLTTVLLWYSKICQIPQVGDGGTARCTAQYHRCCHNKPRRTDSANPTRRPARLKPVSQRRPFKDFQKPPQGGFFLLSDPSCQRLTLFRERKGKSNGIRHQAHAEGLHAGF